MLHCPQTMRRFANSCEGKAPGPLGPDKVLQSARMVYRMRWVTQSASARNGRVFDNLLSVVYSWFSFRKSAVYPFGSAGEFPAFPVIGLLSSQVGLYRFIEFGQKIRLSGLRIAGR